MTHVGRSQRGWGAPVPPIDDSAYLAALDDPDMVEIGAARHFMRRETWERYKDLFPLRPEREAATQAEKIRATIAKKQARIQAARDWRARMANANA